MGIIGNFNKQENGGYDGTFETLITRTRITFEIAAKRNDNSPDFRLVSGASEVGAAWDRTGKSGRYLSVLLDDPTFSAPIYCRLVKTSVERRFSLLWDRPKQAKAS